ncbi:PIH1 domain-containing protein 1 [Chlorella vulgaris]
MLNSAPVAVAAAPPRPATSATRRRAVDVVVLGSSLQAYAAAYLLARRGKRTVLVDAAAPQLMATSANCGGDLVLHLPAPTAHLVNEATEALALWRGIEAACGARDLLQMCGTLDIAPPGSGPAAAALGAMQEASRAADLRYAMLAASEVSASFPRLRPPRGSAALFTNQGGVVNGKVAAAALAAMARRAGVDVAATGRCLLGWRDSGSHFAVRTASSYAAAAAVAAPGGEHEAVFECEQLLLLPDAAVQRQTLALFGLSVPGAELWQVPRARWAAQQECAALPVWQLLGTGSRAVLDDPSAIDSCWGLPLLDWSGQRGGTLIAQSLADGQAAPDDDGKEQQQQDGQQQGLQAGGDGGDGGGGRDSTQQVLQAQAAAAVLAGGEASDFLELAAGGVVEKPGSEEAVDAGRQRQAEQQRQQEVAQQRLSTAGSLAAQLVQGMGGRLAGKEGLLRCLVTADGEGAVGSHPGFESGRIVAAFPATAAGVGCLPADQLAPLVARLAMNELLGQAPEAVEAALVALGREALGAKAELMESLQAMQASGPGAAGGAAQPPPGEQLEVFPEPGFVIKTVNEQGAKVFINMCGTNKLAMPPGWSKGQVPAEVKHHLESRQGGEAPPSMRFPLSLAPPRLDKDHNGSMCMVMDCIVSSEVLACCSDYRPLKFFLIQLALATAAQMVGLELSPQYKLPKMRYKGEMPPPPARIRPQGGPGALRQQHAGSAGGGSGSSKRLITEVSPAADEAPSFALLASKRQQRLQQEAVQPAVAMPQSAGGDGGAAVTAASQQAVQKEQREQDGQLEKLHAQVHYRGSPVDFVAIAVPLPAAALAAAQHEANAISTSVCADTVRVQAPGCQPLKVKLPFAVSAAGGTAEVVVGGDTAGSLMLMLPYRPFSSVLEELGQAAGAADGHSSPKSSCLSELD